MGRNQIEGIGKGPFKIFVVEDHPVMRNMVVDAVETCKRLKTCGTAGNATDAVSRIKRLSPDLVLLDISLPDRNGLTIIKEVHASMGHVKFLVLSIHFDWSYVEEALEHGACGFIHKEEAPTRLLPSIFEVLNGGIVPLPGSRSAAGPVNETTAAGDC